MPLNLKYLADYPNYPPIIPFPRPTEYREEERLVNRSPHAPLSAGTMPGSEPGAPSFLLF